MQLQTINTGFFKLDGGAMFGVVPRVLWQKLEQPDENNLCTWAMRCLLLSTDDGRRILIDTGIGNKQSQKFFSHYYLHGEDSLHSSLAQVGLTADDITDVFLTHLHFDHVGGAVQYVERGAGGEKVLAPTFQNAKYWTNKAHYDWAYTPNARESASFLRENFTPLLDVLNYLPAQPHDQILSWLPQMSVQFAYGHTEAMMLPHLHINGRTVVYCADLLPSPSHLPLPYVMGYDVRPLQTLAEKEWFLNLAAERDYVLFFEHAPHIEACTLRRDERGRIVVREQGSLSDLLA